MIIEQRTYRLKPGAVPEFLRIYGSEGYELQKSLLKNPVGYYYTEIGGVNEVVHMWAYESFARREELRADLLAHPEWQAFLGKVGHLLDQMDNKILRPAAFSPLPQLKD
ncbi:NIPSNAP family protein [Aliamphritea hakodatensis]|uniref:NIPSNAP family protein n=1 Tax=Aliamphritea hakodatensis TaxID=2895352 RepID=UPI0022FD6EEF|nr:NIPSNAP family protein [Aliamphritea hakodatensis]